MGITLTDNEIFGGLFEFELPITFVANLHITKAITDTQHCAVRIATLVKAAEYGCLLCRQK